MATCQEVESWSIEGVCELLLRKIEDIDGDTIRADTIRAFTANKGKAFVMLTETQSDLRELVPKLGERKQVHETSGVATSKADGKYYKQVALNAVASVPVNLCTNLYCYMQEGAGIRAA